MNTNDRINKIIQQFLDSKGDYSYLKPICIANEGYSTVRGVKFDPHPDYPHKKAYDVKDDLREMCSKWKLSIVVDIHQCLLRWPILIKEI